MAPIWFFLPSGSTSRATLRASEVAMSVLAAVTARIMQLGLEMCFRIKSLIWISMSLGWSPTGTWKEQFQLQAKTQHPLFWVRQQSRDFVKLTRPTRGDQLMRLESKPGYPEAFIAHGWKILILTHLQIWNTQKHWPDEEINIADQAYKVKLFLRHFSAL